MEVDVLEHQRTEPGSDLGADPAALDPHRPGLQLLDGRVDIERIPPGDRIETEAQRAQLILHAPFISPGQAAEVAEEDAAGQLMARFADVELGPDHPPVLLDMDDLE
ncbi:hypothetical protein OHA77_40530 [Streptosporangium sp. NBC_01639]|nr:hypothetical protein OHA77_40530 [Streptosporangium sp. NBC_01639]